MICCAECSCSTVCPVSQRVWPRSVNAVLDYQQGTLYIAAVVPDVSHASDITVTVPANAAGAGLL